MAARKKKRRAGAFSDEALQCALFYLLARHLKLEPVPCSDISEELVDELVQVLKRSGVPEERIPEVLQMIAATKEIMENEPTPSLTGQQYDDLRLEFLEEMGVTSTRGTVVWPPTRQTLMQRFGTWNGSLERFGLSTVARGRPPGALRFSEEDYVDSLRDFTHSCEDQSRPATFVNYGEWVREESQRGDVRPSGAAVRIFFGSWSAALDSAA